MRKILFICVFLAIILTNNIFAKALDSSLFVKEDVIGLSYSNAFYENDINAGFLEARWQKSYRINGYPIIPYQEANIAFGLSDKTPSYYVSLLFGFKRHLINDHNFILSTDLGVGVAVGGGDKKKELSGLIAKIGFDVAYSNFVLRYGIGINTGFPFNGTFFAGLNYAF